MWKFSKDLVYFYALDVFRFWLLVACDNKANKYIFPFDLSMRALLCRSIEEKKSFQLSTETNFPEINHIASTTMLSPLNK